MEDGSKSTDPANAKLFKEKKPKAAGKDQDKEESDDEEPICLPKRAASSYNCFSTQWMKEMKEKDESLTGKDLMTRAGEAWSKLDDKAKQPYEKMALKDKERCDKQKADLEKKGYFILDDGSKSTDEKNIPKKKAKRTKKVKAAESSEEDPQPVVEKPKKQRKSLKKQAEKELDIESEDDKDQKPAGALKGG